MDKGQWARVGSFVLGAFSLLVTLAQLVDLSPRARILIGVGTALSLATSVALFRRAKRYQNALRSAPVEARSVLGYSFRPAATQGAFEAICRISKDLYGQDYVPFTRSVRWWRRYPKGVYGAYYSPPGRAEEIVGYVSMWPLRKGTYQRLRQGKMREGDIAYQSIEGGRGGRAWWYVSNIVVMKSRRRVLLPLLQRAMAAWMAQGDLASKLHVLTFAYSPGGHDLIRRFRFNRLMNESADGWPMFELEIERRQLQEVLDAAIGNSLLRLQAKHAERLGGDTIGELLPGSA